MKCQIIKHRKSVKSDLDTSVSRSHRKSVAADTAKTSLILPSCTAQHGCAAVDRVVSITQRSRRAGKGVPVAGPGHSRACLRVVRPRRRCALERQLRASVRRVRRAPFPADPSASLLAPCGVPVRPSGFPVRRCREFGSKTPKRLLFSRVESGPNAARSPNFPVFSRRSGKSAYGETRDGFARDCAHNQPVCSHSTGFGFPAGGAGSGGFAGLFPRGRTGGPAQRRGAGLRMGAEGACVSEGRNGGFEKGWGPRDGSGLQPKPRTLRCSSQASGSWTPFINALTVRPSGSRPPRIASTMSGARWASRSMRMR